MAYRCTMLVQQPCLRWPSRVSHKRAAGYWRNRFVIQLTPSSNRGDGQLFTGGGGGAPQQLRSACTTSSGVMTSSGATPDDLEGSTAAVPEESTARAASSTMPDPSLGKPAKEALAVVQKLRTLGLDACVDLPRVCVAGKQSSGKSSLIEALVGVTVPRDAGTCTRCPFEISTREYEGPLQCTVSLRRLSESGESSLIPVASTGVIGELPDILSTAQQLLLCPNTLQKYEARLQKEFVSMAELKDVLSQQAENRESFSKNVVMVEIKGEALIDLDLIDLPGLIQSSEEGKEMALVDLIQRLCADYFSQPNTLIVMCCPCNDDMENQAVWSLAREHDPTAKRTIGVMTKADLVPRGAEHQVLKIMKNEVYTLEHGYYTVRRSNQADLNAGVTQARTNALEQNFFEHDSLGQQLHRAAPSRCGINALRNCLAENLKRLILSQLPGIEASLREKFHTCEMEMAEMGAVLTRKDARRHLLSCVDAFCNQMVSHVEAKGVDVEFWTTVRAIYCNFRQECYRTRPNFMAARECLPDGDLVMQPQSKDHPKSFLISNAGEPRVNGRYEMCDGIEGKYAKYRRCDHHAATMYYNFDHKEWRIFVEDYKKNDTLYMAPHTTGEVPVETWETCARALPGTLEVKVVTQAHQTKEEVDVGNRRQISIEEVRQLVDNHRGRELRLPGGPAAYRVVEQIVTEARRRWDEPATQCISEVALQLRSMYKAVAQNSFGAHPRLEERVVPLLENLLQEALENTSKLKSKLLFDLEGASDLYTQNDHYLKDSFDNAQRMLWKAEGCALQLDRLSAEQRKQVDALLRKAGHKAAELMVPGTADEAIWCMAAAYSYHKVAFKRFCDYLPRAIDAEMLRFFEKECGNVLTSGLKLLEEDDAVLHSLIEEDQAVRQRRNELSAVLNQQKQGLEVFKEMRAVQLP